MSNHSLDVATSLLLWDKGDHEVVDEELVRNRNTSSVNLRLPPSQTGVRLFVFELSITNCTFGSDCDFDKHP